MTAITVSSRVVSFRKGWALRGSEMALGASGCLSHWPSGAPDTMVLSAVRRLSGSLTTKDVVMLNYAAAHRPRGRAYMRSDAGRTRARVSSLVVLQKSSVPSHQLCHVYRAKMPLL